MSITFKGNKEAERAINLIKFTDQSIFLTGKAGTGKSTLLRYILSDLKKNSIVLAPTGIAALNIGGQTIHSFFKFSFRPYLPEDKELPNLHDKIDILKRIEVIVIDEISMVRSDLMNAIDLTLRKYINNKLPFGGKQLFLIGDLLQLPPVVQKKDKELVKVLRENYSSEYFFSAKCFNGFKLELIELQKVYRQEQIDFVNVLNNIRTNQITEADLNFINTRYDSNHNHENNIVKLTTTNPRVNEVNKEGLARIDKPLHTFRAIKTGTFADGSTKENTPTEDILELKEGAQIIFVKNDPEKRWVNGSIGKISSLENGEIEVYVNGIKCKIDRTDWEDVDFKWNKEKNIIEKETVGVFSQYPIRLAWAMTIHKSQGQTFKDSIIDLDTGAFANGQTYVALSRCTTFEGIVLSRKINFNDIKVSELAINYLKENGLDSLDKRDSLENDLIEKLIKLDTQNRENHRQKEITLKDNQIIKERLNALEAEVQTLRTENKYLKIENHRLSEITWVQRLFGAK